MAKQTARVRDLHATFTDQFHDYLAPGFFSDRDIEQLFRAGNQEIARLGLHAGELQRLLQFLVAPSQARYLLTVAFLTAVCHLLTCSFGGQRYAFFSPAYFNNHFLNNREAIPCFFAHA